MSRKVERVEFKKPINSKVKRVAAYARVSTEKEAMLHSLSAQVSYYSSYIQSHSDWEYCGVYADEARTGTKDVRENFQRLMSDCKARKIDLILTKSISRFARNTVTLLQTVRELKNIGVDVYFEEQNIHTMSADGELMLTLLASYAQEESLSASENQKWRIRKNFQQGIPSTFVLYGYRCEKGEITVYEPEAEIVRKIFDLYLSGIGSINIARHLTALKIPSPNGNEWCSQTIVGILQNEKYTGDMLLQKYYSKNHLCKTNMRNKGELPKYYVENSHESIIPKEKFDAVQKIFSDKTPLPRKTEEYKFKGMVFCGLCGKRYTRKKNYKKYVWRCQVFQNQGKDKCPSKQVPDSVLREMGESFKKEISKVIVFPENKLKFVFADNSEVCVTWKMSSRSESWTDEMREKARIQTIERKAERNNVKSSNSYTTDNTSLYKSSD